MFPHPTDSPEASEYEFPGQNGDEWTATDLTSLDDIDFELQAGLDPSKWGIPRAFFVVHAPVERPVDADIAC